MRADFSKGFWITTMCYGMFGSTLQNDKIKIELKSCTIIAKTQMESFHLFFALNLSLVADSFSNIDNLSKNLTG